MANLGLKMQEKIQKRQFSDSLGGGDKSGRERYRTGFPAAGDIIHRERHTEPAGMVYSRFFSAENCGQNV